MPLHPFLTSRPYPSTSLLSLLLLSTPAWPDSVSDLLLVLGADGQRYTAQHTLTTEAELMKLALPAGRISLITRFSGPEKLTLSKAHAENQDQIAITSGSVLTRYRYTRSQSDLDDENWQLSEDGSMLELTQHSHQYLDVEAIGSLQTSITWILPDSASVVSFNDVQQQDDQSTDVPGRWQTSGNTLNYTKSGGPGRILSISINLDRQRSDNVDECQWEPDQPEDCAPDMDNDNVPDYRDVCLPDSTVPENLPSTSASEDAVDDIGCGNTAVVILSQVQFQSGQSYLDVASRHVLDRLAKALQRMPDQLFEVGSHTDNAGQVSHNQRLSENRADAVRHYLMLRGVGPNQLTARGYGETSPAYDNSEAAGRRANRRMELKRLD